MINVGMTVYVAEHSDRYKACKNAAFRVTKMTWEPYEPEYEDGPRSIVRCFICPIHEDGAIGNPLLPFPPEELSEAAHVEPEEPTPAA